jgi:hypothetical protein
VDRVHGLTKRAIVDLRPVEKRDDRGAIAPPPPAEPRAFEGGATFRIPLPWESVAGDQDLDDFDRAAARCRVQRQIPSVADARVRAFGKEFPYAVDISSGYGH